VDLQCHGLDVQKPLPQEVLWGVDAEQTVALLRPYVTSNGSIPPPSRDDLFRKAD
jgi:hypothetical protein